MISLAAPAIRLPREASFSFCTSWVCKRFWLSYPRRDSFSRVMSAWSWKYWRRKTKAPSTSIAASTVKTRNAREGTGDLSSKTVHTPKTGSDRSASIASRGMTFFHHSGCKLERWLSRSHCRADKANAASHATVPMRGMSYGLPE